MALPYTLDLTTTTLSVTGPFGVRLVSGSIPDSRTAAGGSGSQGISVSCAGQGGESWQLEISIDGTNNRLSEELEDAVLELSDVGGDGTVLAEIVLSDHDTSEPYSIFIASGRSQIVNGDRSGLRLTFQTPGAREFDFDISALGGSPSAFTVIGSTDDSDDQRIDPFLLRANSGEIDSMRVRDNQFRIQMASADGRFSEEVEDYYLLSMEGPPGTRLALLNNIGGAWRAGQSQYRFNSADYFIDGTRAGLNTAIRALGAGATVRLRIIDPLLAAAAAQAPASAGAATAGLAPIPPKAAAAQPPASPGIAQGGLAPIPPKAAAAQPPASPGAASAGTAIIRPFFLGAQPPASPGAAIAGARKIPVGPPKPMGAQPSASPGAIQGGLAKLIARAGAQVPASAGIAQGGIHPIPAAAATAQPPASPGAAIAGAQSLAPFLDSPRDLEITIRERFALVLGWNAPADDFGLPVSYEVRIGTGPWQGTPNPFFRAINLDAGTQYQFFVRARNRAGPGSIAGPLNGSTLQPIAPGPPRFLIARPLSAESIALDFEPPLSDGGAEILHYEFSIIADDGSISAYARLPDSRRLAGLARGARYEFRLRAVNAVGAGAPTDPAEGSPLEALAPAIASGQRIPLIDADRQALILRIAGRDCRLRTWWQPSDRSWWASLEVPVNTPIVQSRRLPLNAGLLDRIADVLPGNIRMRELGDAGMEPRRDAWERQTHALIWEAD